VKIVNTEHTDHAHFSIPQRVVNSVTYPLVDVQVSNSKHTAASTRWYEDLLLASSQENVIYNGVSATRIDEAGESNPDLPDSPIFVTVGRLVEAKNHATLLRSFERVVEHVPNATLVIIGDGPLSTELHQLSRDLSIDESTLFTGHLTRDEVYAVLNKSTLAVFPSWYEGFCVAAVEAMAAGLPVVASDIDVLHEVIGGPGVFVNPGDPEAIAEATIDLLEHPEKRDDIANRAKERARSTFSIERTAEEYYKIYTDLAETSYR
jgi:glycosyltransferase involved in cell wall biosynthesis